MCRTSYSAASCDGESDIIIRQKLRIDDFVKIIAMKGPLPQKEIFGVAVCKQPLLVLCLYLLANRAALACPTFTFLYGRVGSIRIVKHFYMIGSLLVFTSATTLRAVPSNHENTE